MCAGSAGARGSADADTGESAAGGLAVGQAVAGGEDEYPSVPYSFLAAHQPCDRSVWSNQLPGICCFSPTSSFVMSTWQF